LHEFSLAQIFATTIDIIVDDCLIFNIELFSCRLALQGRPQSLRSIQRLKRINWIYSGISAEMAMVLSERVFSRIEIVISP
jgi:hypothetical protein